MSLNILKKNISAIKLAIQLNKEEKNPTQEDLVILNQFKGWGGVKAVHYPLDRDWNTISTISKVDMELETYIKELYELLKENFPDKYDKIWDSIKLATLTSFYTPDNVVDTIIKKQSIANPHIENFLEPSTGMGIYVDKVLEYFPNIKDITAVEKDFLTAFIISQKYKGNDKVNVINKGFEEIAFSEKFDFIASNIPFGDIVVNSKTNYPAEVTSKIHNFFAFHCSELLKDGGQMALISSTGLMNSKSNKEVRKLIGENCVFNNLITLPNNSFKEAKTEVSSHLIVATKTSVRSEEERENNKIFIETYTHDNGIVENEYLVLNPHIGFLGQDIGINTNPYGQLEHNYKIKDKEIFDTALNKFLFFPKTHIEKQENEKTLKIEYDYYPNIKLSSPEHQEQSKYLEKFIRFENTRDFNGYKLKKTRIVGAIKGTYKGKEIPIATVLRSDIENSKKGVYAIDIYLKHKNITIPSKGWQDATTFKIEFNRLVNEIETLSQDNLIEVSTDTPRTEDGENFNKYWADKFCHPELTQVYRIDLGKYQFYNLPKENNLLINNNGEIQKIIEVENIQGENLYLLEKISLPTIEQDKLYSLLMINHHYNSFLNFEKKVKELTNFNELQGKKDAVKSKFDKIINNLNRDYDEFVKKYGSINENKDFIKKYIPDYSPFLTSLEIIENESKIGTDLFSFEQEIAKKSDIFNYQFIIDEKELNVIISPAEALLKSINTKGSVDLEFISKLTGIEDEKQLLDELDDRISYNPISNEYELKEIFLSGDIYKKIDNIKNTDVSSDIKEVALNELESVLPEKVSYHQITKQVGSRWIPTEILNKFFNEIYNSRFSILYNQNTDNFNVTPSFKGQGYSQYKCISGRFIKTEDIITNAFYDTYPVVKYTVEIDGVKENHIDEKATRYYKNEIDRVKVAFQNYINNLSDVEKQRLEEIYNRKFNAIALPKIDGSILNFEDMNLGNMNIKDIYPHQKDAVWKTIINQGGVVDHEVGFGKTLTMCALAHKMKSLKIVKKPLILGLAANVKELANTYTKLFPDAKILYASPKDYELKNREEFINKIKTNDWDVIIMSHHQFERIPQSEKVEKELIEQELKEIEENLYEVAQNNPTKKQLLGLRKSQENLTKKLAELNENINKKKDKNILNFDDLGIDHIIIDESHFFKNLPFLTKHNQVSGLGSANKMDEGKKNRNLLTAIRTIQRNTPTGDFGATFFSGTPISNSLTELYLIQKYLTPNLLKEKGIYNFDSWASNFAMKSVEFEANMVNEIVAKERFRYFVNLPELGKSYNYISHIMNGRIDPKMVDRPRLEEKLILSEQTALQRKFNVRLSRFINTGQVELLNIEKELKEGKNIEKARSLVAMNLAFDASIDMRIINSKFPDEAGSKINTMVEDVLNTYRKFDQQKGTQIIFSDRGKTDKNLSFEALEENYNNNVFTSIYEDIKYKLVRAGVPEKEVAFIHHWDNKKEELSRKMNSGEIRILIGSTEKAGTGLNVQSKLVSVKHLTIPWKPSEFEQRNGRGYRKGNIIAKEYNDNKFESGIMGTQNTLDTYKIDLNKNKAKFIDQIRNASNNNIRIADEGEVDESTGMNLAELQAQLMGDNTLLEKTKIDKKIKELEQEKNFIAGEVYSAKNEIKKATKRIEELDVIIDHCQKDLETANSNIQYDEKTKKRINNPNYVSLAPDASAEEIKKYFMDINMKVKEKDKDYTHKIGEMYGFTLYAVNTFWEGVKFYMTRTDGDGKTKYEYNSGRPNFDTETGAKNYFISCFNSIAKRLESNERLVKSLSDDLKRFELKQELKFDQDDLLDELRGQREKLEYKLKNRTQQDEFESKAALNYEGVMDKFYVFRNLKSLDKGFLLDKVGMDYSTGSAFFSKECLEILEKVAEKGNIEIYGKIEDVESNLYLATYHLKDSFLLYADLDKEIKEKQNQNQNKEQKEEIFKPKNKAFRI